MIADPRGKFAHSRNVFRREPLAPLRFFAGSIGYFGYFTLPGGSWPLHISLPPELEPLVDDKVTSGRYASASEVIREGPHHLEEREQFKQQRLVEVRGKIDRGIELMDRGEDIPRPEARACLRRARVTK